VREPLDLDDPRCSAIGTTRMLAPEFSNVRVWLRRLTTVLTAPDKQRLLLPQQPTFQPASPLFT
jgi:hypothetical protein